MSFYKEKQKMDLGNTNFENIFLNDFMPQADGLYVKVYLLGYKYSEDVDENFSNLSISKNLNVSEEEVDQAWTYWENQGIIRKHYDNEGNYSVEFINLKQLYVEKVYTNNSNSQEVSFNDLVESNKKESTKDMFEELRRVLGRELTFNEKRKVLSWKEKFSFNNIIIIQGFIYCIERKNVKSFKYIESVLSSWYDSNIKTIEDLGDYFEKQSEIFGYYRKIKNSLGFSGRQLTKSEMDIIDKWFFEWNFSIDMVLKALENSSKIPNPNINYFNSILNDWHKKGYKKVSEIKERKKSNYKDNKKSKKKSDFDNFEQRYESYSPEELDKIARRKFNNKNQE
jgi:DnaD/phage-associated family protein